MKVMKNSLTVLCVSFVLGICTENVLALPYSAFGAANGWQGYKSYNQDGIKMTVMFNVYDTAVNHGEFTWNSSVPQDGRYIYAYQILNDTTSKDISLFRLLDKSNNPLDQSTMNSSTSQSDGFLTSVKPGPCAEQGLWEWTPDTGFVGAGDRSWYLIFSSNYAPVKGSFKVETAGDEGDISHPTPEPASLALLGAASALFAAKRGRKRQAV
jgi:hypothetical protein